MYKFTLKNIKQSIFNLETFFKEKGYDIPHSTLLHGFSKALFFPNWNTMMAQLEKPETFTPTMEYIVRFKSEDLSGPEFEKMLFKCAEDSNCKILIHQKQQFLDFLEIRLTNPLSAGKGGARYSNILTCFMLLIEILKKSNVKVSIFEYWQVRIENQNFKGVLD